MFPDPRSAHRRAILLLAFCALCWSIAGVVTRHLESADGFEVTFWRAFFCTLTVLIILAWQRRGNALAPVLEMGWPGLFSGAMWGVMFTAFMLALTRTSVANTLLVMSVGPLLSAVIGRIVLGTRVSPPTWIAIAMAGIGIWWMVHEGVSTDGLVGMTIALAVPVAAAINVVTLKRIHADLDLAPAVLVGALLCCLVTAPLAWPFQAGARDLALLGLLGSVQLAIPCFLMIRAVRHLAPHEVALIALLEVVLGPIWAWLGAGEAMPAATIQGGVIVLAALIGNTLLSPRPPAVVRPAGAPAGLH
jgi:drug/metabolite transporter (DMT)-like permease